MAFDKSKFIDQFKAETREHIQTLNLGLLKLEKNTADRELLNAMMREAHSIKGAARMMGYQRIGDITHKMEDGLQRALNGELQLTKECFELLFRCLDALEPLLQDKVTWTDTGIDRPFTEDLCVLADKVFAGEWEGPLPAAPGQTVVPPKAPADGDAGAEPPQPVPPSVAKVEEAAPLAEESIRVDTDKLNRLINLSGELLISKIRLDELTRAIVGKAEAQATEIYTAFSELTKGLDTVSSQIDYLTENLQEEMLKVRMLPVGNLFNTFPRAMRDLANEKNKQIDFVIDGQETQLDKAILDEMRIPLMHLLRNAVDHGIELPEERKKKGKPPAGKIVLSAAQEGSQVNLRSEEHTSELQSH